MDTRGAVLLRSLPVEGLFEPEEMAVDTRLHRALLPVWCPTRIADPLGWVPGWLRARVSWLDAPAPAPPASGCVKVIDTAR
jgi:hypothetical protein